MIAGKTHSRMQGKVITCCVIITLLVLPQLAKAQSVSISSDGSDPNANAMLDIQNPSSGNGKGLLIPQVSETQRTTADATLDGGLLDDDGNLRGGVAAQGLMVYQTDGTEGFYYNTSTTTTPSWIYLIPNSGSVDGTFNSVTVSEDNAYYLGTTKVLHRGNGSLSGNLVLGDGGGNLSNSSDFEGCYNTFTGLSAGTSCTTGYENTAVGYGTLYSLTTGNYNTAVGNDTLNSLTTGAFNTAVGNDTLSSLTTGSGNTGVGWGTLFSNTTGGDNTAAGWGSLFSNTTGEANVALGIDALSNNTTGNYNVGIGFGPLQNNATGGSNVACGYRAGETNIDGSYNTFVGCEADMEDDGLKNAMALGYKATVDANNKVVIGNSSVNTIGGYADWSNYSDRREKKEITNCNIGLEFVERLRPVNFKYKNQDKLRNGFIAQEVEAVCKETGVEFGGLTKPADKNGRYMLSYGEFVVPLVNCVKELKNENNALKERLERDDARIRKLESQLESINKKLQEAK